MEFIKTKKSEIFKNKVLKRFSEVLIAVGKEIENVNKFRAIEKGEGHHSVVTKADELSQKFLIEKLLQIYPTCKFIVEEKSNNENVLTEKNYLEYLDGVIASIDPVDGTSQYANGLYEWCVAVGIMENGKQKESGIYAPKILGGFLVLADESGSYFKEGDNALIRTQVKKYADESVSVAKIGVDVIRHKKFNSFVNVLSQRFQSATTTGSCALGMGLVASGKIDLLFQSPQKIWDWFGGYFLIESAGGKVQFYKIVDDKIIFIDKPSKENYSPASKDIGFLAGVPNLVDQFAIELNELYNK